MLGVIRRCPTSSKLESNLENVDEVQPPRSDINQEIISFVTGYSVFPSGSPIPYGEWGILLLDRKNEGENPVPFIC